MKNYYEILGVEKTAALATIKKSYKELLLKHHTDKGGDKNKAILIIEAYELLSDPEKRKKYDEAFETYHAENRTPVGHLTCVSPPFSMEFRKQHQRLCLQHAKEPLKQDSIRGKINADYLQNNLIHKLLQRLNADNVRGGEIFKPSWTDFTPAVAVQLLTGFLQARYTRKTCRDILELIEREIKKLKASYHSPQIIALYEGVYDCISILNSGTPNEHLIKATEKIVNYIKWHARAEDNDFSELMENFAALIASKLFRDLVAFALYFYWTSPNDELDATYLSAFNGTAVADRLLASAKDRIASEPANKAIVKLLRFIKLLARQERMLQQSPKENEEQLANFYRDKGYLILDWVPGLTGIANQDILLNTFMQAAICFLTASRAEKVPAFKMADEKLAYHLFTLIISISHESTPPIELYTNIHIVRFLTQGMFADDELGMVVTCLQERALELVNIFPVFQSYTANINLFEDEGKTLGLMRQLLHYLVALGEQQHDYVRVLYQAYDACLKNWYENTIDLKQENSFRLKLMRELLRINRWTFADVNALIKPKTAIATVKRDLSDWIKPNRELEFSSRGDDEYLTTIAGVEIDYRTGSIKMNFKPWQASDPLYKKLFTMRDVSQITEKKIVAAEFSLDPPDVTMPHHPFNQIRFAPSSLYQSELLHTMLLADYLLKFLTVGYEVQGGALYDLRHVDELIKPLPAYLRKIITDFHAAKHSGATHRFWIETEDLPTSANEAECKESGVMKFAFGDLRMVVKKHKMVRGFDGKLVDEENTNEGWNIYVLTSQQKRDFDRGILIIPETAILLVEKEANIHFIENGKLAETFQVKNYDHTLLKLSKLKRNAIGKVSTENSKELQLVYTFTKKVIGLAEKSHQFSPEFIFAQEFSIHYNEFAMYFPELGRLRELSKAVMITRVLAGQHELNKKNLNSLKSKLSDDNFWQPIHDKIYDNTESVVKENFANWRESMQNILNQYAKNIDEIKQNVYRACNQANVYVPDSVRHDLIRKQITSFLPASTLSYVEDYLHGSGEGLISAIIRHVKGEVVNKIQGMYTEPSQDCIYDALNDKPYAINIIIVSLVNNQLNKQKAHLQEEINKLEKLDRAFLSMGLGKAADIHLDKLCLWVPASIHHEAGKNYSRLVYGGVRIGGKVYLFEHGNPFGILLPTHVGTGMSLYRTWGGGARSDGISWTTINPAVVPNYRDAVGLPDKNAGRFLSHGILIDKTGVTSKFPAHPLDGNRGGLPELIVPDPAKQIKIVRVVGVNPRF
jgi:hypothetical protein